MAYNKKPSNEDYDNPPDLPSGFDVTCIVGRVEFDLTGNGISPYRAALDLIGKHSAPGIYTFPHENGATVTVTIEY